MSYMLASIVLAHVDILLFAVAFRQHLRDLCLKTSK